MDKQNFNYSDHALEAKIKNINNNNLDQGYFKLCVIENARI